MELVIDVETIIDFFARAPWEVVTDIFFGGGWVVLVFILFALIVFLWRDYLEGRAEAAIEYVLLAVDVPRENEQALKAVEQLFSHLAGAYEKPKFLDTYWRGFSHASFSFEIVSLEGYVQFLIRTPVGYRDLISASLYAQYPDAEITELTDYTGEVPHHFPNPDWDMWGTELVLKKPEAYPIRTHINFEDKLSGYFKDPMSAILEVLSTLQSGEQMWIQLVVAPCDQDKWKEESEKIVNELIGEESEHKETFFLKFLKLPILLIDEVIKSVFPPGEHDNKQKDKPKNLLQFLTPGRKDVVAAIEDKASKVGHEIKIRIVYIAHRDVFVKARRVGAILGSFTQFSTLNLNGFGTGKLKVKAGTLFAARGLAKKQNALMHAYVTRSPHGYPPFILNIEELATIWHFPLATVKAPLVMKTEAKKGEPPFRLPVVDEHGKPMIQTYRAGKS